MDIFVSPPYVFLSIFILVSSLLSFSSPSRSPCHQTSTTAAPLDLAPAVALQYYIHSLLSSLITGSPSHTTPHALSPARLSLSTFAFAFPPLSLCSVHCIAAVSDSYKYPALALPKGRQIGPYSPFFCVCFRATAAPSVSSRLCSRSLVPCPTRSCLSPLATVACEPVRSAQLTISSPLCLDCRLVTHTCGSGNNKPRTLLPVTLACVPSSGTSRGFIYIAHFRTLARTLTPLYNWLPQRGAIAFSKTIAPLFPLFFLLFHNHLDCSLPSVAPGNLAHDQSTSAKRLLRAFHPKRPSSATHRRTAAANTTTPSKHKPIQPVPASPRSRVRASHIFHRPRSRTHHQHRLSTPT